MSDYPHLKPLFRKLLQRHHPDKHPTTSGKGQHTALTLEILAAYERGDEEALVEIERLGLAYRRPAPRFAPEPDGSTWQPSASGVGEPWGYATTRVSRSDIVHDLAIGLIFPWALPAGMLNWNENGRLANAASLIGAVAWGWIAWWLWHELGNLSVWLNAHGWIHASVPGLIVALLRVALVLGAAPIVVSLGIAAFQIGMLLVVGLLTNAIASFALGLIHPWLSYLPPFFIGALGIAIFWDLLDRNDQ